VSAVTIRIRAVRGTTSYEFEAFADENEGAYTRVEQDATAFERWISMQPDRSAKNDAEYLQNRGAH
jgi:hypothetical protein